MKEMLKSTGAALVIASSLFLFALACAEAPMAPQDEQAGLVKPVDTSPAMAKPDTLPPPGRNHITK
jgi:hypothetical protein